MNDKRKIGNQGEDAAADYLVKNGYRIIERNYSCRWGEIDIIAQKDGVIAFVEVKYRKDDTHGEAKEFVTLHKQKRIIKTALMYLSASDCELQPRFDVIEVYPHQGLFRKNTIRFIPDAFGA